MNDQQRQAFDADSDLAMATARYVTARAAYLASKEDDGVDRDSAEHQAVKAEMSEARAAMRSARRMTERIARVQWLIVEHAEGRLSDAEYADGLAAVGFTPGDGVAAPVPLQMAAAGNPVSVEG